MPLSRCRRLLVQMMWLGSTISQTWTDTFNCILPEEDSNSDYESDELMLEARRKARIGDKAKLEAGAVELRKPGPTSFDPEKMHSVLP